jgi:hypothetical protein
LRVSGAGSGGASAVAGESARASGVLSVADGAEAGGAAVSGAEGGDEAEVRRLAAVRVLFWGGLWALTWMQVVVVGGFGLVEGCVVAWYLACGISGVAVDWMAGDRGATTGGISGRSSE